MRPTHNSSVCVSNWVFKMLLFGGRVRDSEVYVITCFTCRLEWVYLLDWILTVSDKSKSTPSIRFLNWVIPICWSDTVIKLNQALPFRFSCMLSITFRYHSGHIKSTALKGSLHNPKHIYGIWPHLLIQLVTAL